LNTGDFSAALSKVNARPLYRQLADQLRSDIRLELYPAGSRVPTEGALCRRYQVSRVTVRKALALLAEEGILESHQGKGTFVREAPRLQRDLRSVNSFHTVCSGLGVSLSTRVLSAGMISPPAPCVSETLTDYPEMIEIRRVRLCDGEPVVLETNQFPPDYRFLLEEDLTGSLYALLKTRGIEPGQAEHELSLCYAAENEAELLDVARGSALLCLEEAIYDQQGRLLHTSCQHIRGDRFTFRI